MKKSVKIAIVVAVVAIMIFACVALCACNDNGQSDLVAVVASDLLQEDFGIAVTKGNTALMNAVNQVIDE